MNEIYAAERDEYRSALAGMSEIQRAAHCGHSYSRYGVCVDCGDDEPRLDATW